ncbi:hypothetical protein [Vibrio proteolyticus]|uniref:hypothetical protein n=1 Tax=Vibrio proteolyticus TaxID=671 RepID=UPI000402A755|nr:hypothetical protein [Vibrio proteolyticus]
MSINSKNDVQFSHHKAIASSHQTSNVAVVCMEFNGYKTGEAGWYASSILLKPNVTERC